MSGITRGFEVMIIEKKIVIKTKDGLHARPAAIFVQIANKYNAQISVSKGSQTINGKSIMGIMMLAAGKGSKIFIKANGIDAQEAVLELENLLSGKIEV